MSGNMRVNLSGTPGRPVVMRFAETITPDSTLYTANLREANVTDIYIPASTAKATFQPVFVTHGFRYAEIDGFGSGLQQLPVGHTLQLPQHPHRLSAARRAPRMAR